ncbi:MAG TPA: DUF1549 and DUF1553 domain-containing protein [Planctomycetaceae bacterium]|nr:DUF1549 and DUF1553 domain-containing protein [Planctomycetaceae bacterium]
MRLRYIFVLLVAIAASVFSPEVRGADAGHWSLRPCVRPAVPQFEAVGRCGWLRSPLDAFVLKRMAAAGLEPSTEADRRTFIRRLCFDLTGLPPAPEDVAEFVADSSPDACGKLVDRLLASPRYGEKWGRHWLDVVRFAETEGFEYDRHRAGAWRYRDYVVDAFNSDMPYDRFVLEQLAGDELDELRVKERGLARGPQDQDPREQDSQACLSPCFHDHELLVAAGFQRLGPVRRNAGNQELAFSRHEVLTEMTDIVGTAFLGLTVGCARCHDHMFDEIPQRDYFALQAFFAATHEHDVVLAAPEEHARWKARHDAIQGEIKQLKESLAAGLTDGDRREAESRLRELEYSLPAPLPTISTVRNVPDERTPIHVLIRGDTGRPGVEVNPHGLTLLPRGTTGELSADVPNPRTRLARWLTSPENPLTARVLANRLWQFHFGRGLVESANDFGVNGSGPTHPELLDWLAAELVESRESRVESQEHHSPLRWTLKRLHRAIVHSAVYRQASDSGSRLLTLDSRPSTGSRLSTLDSRLSADPENRLLARFPRRRLSAEELRDSMLLVSGRLNERLGGPSVIVPVEADLVHLLYAPTQWAVTGDPREHDRRSIYLLAKRNLRLPFMEAFDQPDAQTSCARRESSTHALQSLELLNGRLSNDLARSFAERLLAEAGPDPERQVDRAWVLAAGRPPTPAERQRSVEFLREQPLSEFALAVFNLNAFLTVD